MKNIYTLVATLIIFLMLTACGDNTAQVRERGRRNLEGRGYTNIQFTGNQTGICEDDDYYDLGFTANKKDGTAVSGAVCAELGENEIEIEWQD